MWIWCGDVTMCGERMWTRECDEMGAWCDERRREMRENRKDDEMISG